MHMQPTPHAVCDIFSQKLAKLQGKKEIVEESSKYKYILAI
jgi:hypothetical protein